MTHQVKIKVWTLRPHRLEPITLVADVTQPEDMSADDFCELLFAMEFRMNQVEPVAVPHPRHSDWNSLPPLRVHIESVQIPD